MFSDAGVREMDISDLYERDESSGRVSFRNPDDPGRPFSNRYEAQQWVDSMNKQINARFNAEVGKAQQNILKNMAPTFAMLEFAPTYQAMSKLERDVFEDIVEPFAIKDEITGQITGYTCNLQAAGRQAQSLAKRFAPQQQSPMAAQQAKPAKQAKPATMPAMDAPSGSGNIGADDEPKTLEEAMMKLRRSRK